MKVGLDPAPSGQGARHPAPLSVSIVVPVLDEAAIIDGSVRRLRRTFADCELVVVDGGSTDTTADRAARHARVLQTPAGRATQMNAGARATHGEVLWFVHADSVIAPGALAQIRAVLADATTVGGGLTLRFDKRSVALDYLAWSSNHRARRLHWIFGDQAMFIRRSVFEEIGGFPSLPLMEDLEISRRLRRRGALTLVPATSTASARRLEQHGVWRMVIFMQYLKALYLAGASPASIARQYSAGPRLPFAPRVRPCTRTRSSRQENDHVG